MCDHTTTMTLDDPTTGEPLRPDQLQDTLRLLLGEAQQSVEQAPPDLPKLASIAENVVRELSFLLSAARPADKQDNPGEEVLKPIPLATLSLRFGQVESDDDQLLVLRWDRLLSQVASIERELEQVNEQLRRRVPLFGDPQHLAPLPSAEAPSLEQLGRLLADRTDDRVQLKVVSSALRSLLAKTA